MTFDKYPHGDVREHGDTRIDHRDKVAKIFFDLRDLGLSPEQRERFIFLLGPRYNESHQVKIVCRQFMTFQENYLRALEQFREIYWESKRAPDRCATLSRNPYRREKILKKLYGRTKEERTASKALLQSEMEEHFKKIDEEHMNKEIDHKPSKESVKRRQEIAQRRAKLGFNDKGATEMEDEVIDKIEYMKHLNNL